MSASSTKSGIAQSLVILGVIFLIIGAMMTYQNRKESRFYPVEGVMKTSEIKYVDSAGSAGKLGSKSWFLNVIYEYEVDGKIYESDNIASESPLSSADLNKPPSKKLTALAEKFAVGKTVTVTVYVSPTYPHRAMLLRTRNYGLWLLAISGLLFALAFHLARR